MKKDRFLELAEIWLNQAKDDLSWAKDTLDDKRYSGVCFLTQQAAEKALKAYLFSKKQRLIRTHNLERLLEKCTLFERKFLRLKRNCQVLNEFYTDTRYPDIWDRTRFNDESLAKDALRLAEAVVKFIERNINLS